MSFYTPDSCYGAILGPVLKNQNTLTLWWVVIFWESDKNFTKSTMLLIFNAQRLVWYVPCRHNVMNFFSKHFFPLILLRISSGNIVTFYSRSIVPIFLVIFRLSTQNIVTFSLNITTMLSKYYPNFSRNITNFFSRTIITHYSWYCDIVTKYYNYIIKIFSSFFSEY